MIPWNPLPSRVLHFMPCPPAPNGLAVRGKVTSLIHRRHPRWTILLRFLGIRNRCVAATEFPQQTDDGVRSDVGRLVVLLAGKRSLHNKAASQLGQACERVRHTQLYGSRAV
jgi:hypothetical protein